jgi:hypothetical protein
MEGSPQLENHLNTSRKQQVAMCLYADHYGKSGTLTSTLRGGGASKQTPDRGPQQKQRKERKATKPQHQETLKSNKEVSQISYVLGGNVSIRSVVKGRGGRSAGADQSNRPSFSWD